MPWQDCPLSRAVIQYVLGRTVLWRGQAGSRDGFLPLSTHGLPGRELAQPLAPQMTISTMQSGVGGGGRTWSPTTQLYTGVFTLEALIANKIMGKINPTT